MGESATTGVDTQTLTVRLAPMTTAFRLDGEGDGGRLVLDFSRDEVAAALAVYALLAPTPGEERLARVTVELV